MLVHGPNTLTFQLTAGNKQIYVVGTYIPPNCTWVVEDIQRAAEVCPAGCKLLVTGALKVNIKFPHDEQVEVIVIDLLHGYMLQTPCRTTTRARWTWSQKRGTTRHYLQPDYILARTDEKGMFMGVRFRFPWFLHSDHCAIIAVVRAGRE